ncbi:hypothetical protein BH10BAC5_BH10BAC5_12490 [soil metagenome]
MANLTINKGRHFFHKLSNRDSGNNDFNMNIPSHNPKALESQLKRISKGIEKNINEWPTGNQINIEYISKIIFQLNTGLMEIKKYEIQLTKQRKAVQEFVNDSVKPLYKKARDQAYSLHGKNSDKLKDYDFKKI